MVLDPISWGSRSKLTFFQHVAAIKFNNFLWVCWFLGKNLSNFVPPAWKLDNPYNHNVLDKPINMFSPYIILFRSRTYCKWMPLVFGNCWDIDENIVTSLESNLYIPSTLNTNYLLWHTHLIVCAIKH